MTIANLTHELKLKNAKAKHANTKHASIQFSSVFFFNAPAGRPDPADRLAAPSARAASKMFLLRGKRQT